MFVLKPRDYGLNLNRESTNDQISGVASSMSKTGSRALAWYDFIIAVRCRQVWSNIKFFEYFVYVKMPFFVLFFDPLILRNWKKNERNYSNGWL